MIGVVGLGYVGLPLAVAFCEAGHEVAGVDTDARVVEALSSGRSQEWPEDADCAVIVTAHPGLDLERVVREAPLVVDFRGVTRGIEAPNLVRL